jgi:WD40 repeat protein
MPDATTNGQFEPFEPFVSLRDLFAANAEIQTLRRERKDPLKPTIEIYLARVRATGVVLAAGSERRAAQSVLDYWSGVLAREGGAFEDVVLDEFNEQRVSELPDDKNPYRGLAPFREDDSRLFFGRQSIVKRACERLVKQRWLSVVGASGSGKSSCVMAGIVPALRQRAVPGSDVWRYFPPIVPGANPLAALWRLLNQARLLPPEMQRDDVTHALRTNAQYLLSLMPADTPVLIVVDQFEEIFTLCPDEAERVAFADALLALSSSAGARHTVIVTMRTEFLDNLARLPALQERFEDATTERMRALNAAELREAIEAPAQAIGLRFEPQLLDRIIDDAVGESEALPLLQVLLMELWKRREHNLITRDSYERIGGWRAALTVAADSFYKDLSVDEQELTRHVLLRVVRPGEGDSFDSKRVTRAELASIGRPPDAIDAVLRKLVAAGLLRESDSPIAEERQFEISHEALVRNWLNFRRWLNAERAALQQRNKIADAALVWRSSGKHSSVLLRGVVLQEALRSRTTLQRQGLGLGREENRFLDVSLQRARLRRLAWWASALAAIIVAVVWISHDRMMRGRAEKLASQALEDERFATAGRLATLARQFSAERLDLSLLLSLTAYHVKPTPEVESALLSGIQQSTYLERFFPTSKVSKSPLIALSRLSNRHELMAAHADGTVARWDVNTSNVVFLRRQEDGDEYTSAVFSADGRWLARVKAHHEVTVVDLTNDRVVDSFKSEFVSGLELSESGRLLAMTHWVTPQKRNVTAIQTSVREVQKQRTLRTADSSHSIARADASAFSPDERWLITAGTRQMTALIVRTGETVPFEEPVGLESSTPTALAVSPDGRLLAGGDSGGRITMWSMDTHRIVLRPWVHHIGPVRTVAFTADGRSLVTAGADNVLTLSPIRAWRPGLEYQRLNQSRLTGHGGSVLQLVAGRESFVSAGEQSIVLWRVNARVILERPLDHSPTRGYTAAMSTDGSAIVARASTAQESSAVWVRNSAGKYIAERLVLPPAETGRLDRGGHEALMPALAVSGSGRVVAYGDGTAGFQVSWRTPARRFEHALSAPARVSCLALNVEGTRLAVGMVDGSVQIWTLSQDSDRPTAKPLRQAVRAHTAVVRTLAFDRRGRLLSGTADSRLIAFDTSGHVMDAWRTAGEDASESIPDGADGMQTRDMPGVLGLAVDLRSGKFVTISDGNALTLWNANHAIQPIEPSLRQVNLQGVSISPDATRLAGGIGNAALSLWAVSSSKAGGTATTAAESSPRIVPLGSLRSTSRSQTWLFDRLEVLGFTVDGSDLVSMGTGPIRLWDVRVDSWRRIACDIANRDLTQGEWDRYVGDNKKWMSTCGRSTAPEFSASARRWTRVSDKSAARVQP